jgi:uncharacterized protein (DUF2267 family)
VNFIWAGPRRPKTWTSVTGLAFSPWYTLPGISDVADEAAGDSNQAKVMLKTLRKWVEDETPKTASRRLHHDVDVRDLAELAQLERGELHLGRAAAAEDVDVRDRPRSCSRPCASGSRTRPPRRPRAACTCTSSSARSVDDDVDVRDLAELAQLERGELHLGRAAAAEDVDAGDSNQAKVMLKTLRKWVEDETPKTASRRLHLHFFLAQLERGELHLGRAAAAEDVDVRDRARLQPLVHGSR